MQIFKNKIFNRVLSLIALIILLLSMDWGLRKLLEPITYATYFNHDIETIEKSDRRVDMVFVGASRVFRTFVPKVFEQKMGLDCVINAGSSAQPICATYYALKDLTERLEVDKVYIGVVWEQLLNAPSTRLNARLIVYDRLSIKNKFLMALDSFSFQEKKYLSAAYRFKDNLDIKTMSTNLVDKKKLRDTNYYSYSENEDYYADKGFVYGYKTYKTGTIPIMGQGKFSKELILQENLEYLDKCIEMCKKKDIEVTLVTGITSVMRMYVIENYQEAVEFYTEYAKEKGIEYYNLNYLKNRETIIPDELMYDYNHINGEGAHKVSELFSNILLDAEKGEDIANYFYRDFEEFKKDVNRIVAVKADITSNEENPSQYHITLQSLQNEDVIPMYRILVKYTGDTDYQIVQDWSNNNELDIGVKEATEIDKIRVEAGTTDRTYAIASQEYELNN